MASLLARDWLEGESTVDGVKHYFCEVIQKVDAPGKAYCIVCEKELTYDRQISNYLRALQEGHVV